MIKRWTILRQSGAAETLSGPGGTSSPLYSYLNVLDHVYRDMQSGGSNYDRPQLLFADGKPVSLPKPLTDLAWDYVAELRKAVDDAKAEVNAKHVREDIGREGS